jgi:ABC-type antimicrobial peptide transport system permease subunit
MVVGTAIIAGAVLAMLLARSLSHRLYAGSVWDPATLVGVALLVLLAALLGALVPAMRAARLESTAALRDE